jgi:N-acetylmuramoyl-L-alanine amidase
MMRIVLALLAMVVSSSATRIEGLKLPEGDKTAIEAIEIDRDLYIKSTDLADFLDGNESINFFDKTGDIDFGAYSIEYSLFSPYVRCGENIYNIYRQVLFSDGAFLLPVRYTVDVLNQVSPMDLTWDGRRIIVAPPVYNVVGINASQKLNGLLIEINLKEKLRYDVVKTDDSWLIVTISEGKVDSLALSGRIPTPAVYEVKSYQFERSVQISVRLRPRDFTFSAKLKEDPYRIQILVRGEGFSDSAMAEEHIAREDFSSNRIDVIVIDPGHGGEDLGAIGPGKSMEKDIVLKISNSLFRLLRDDSRFEPVLTRQDDIFVPLSERTALANSVGGDLFISIHANASSNTKARGLITFFLADAKTDQARAAATLENASIRFEQVDAQKQYLTDLDFTLRDMIQTEFQRESADLADIIQGTMKKDIGMKSRGVDQAGFFVLDKAYMPAVLVETAFISNRDDERLLRDSDFQRKTARAIYESIVAFKEKYEYDKRASE